MPRSPQVNFYLKPPGPDGRSLIYLNYKYNGQRLFFSFGEKVKIKDWNSSKQRAKKKIESALDGEHSLNDLLDTLQEVLEKAYSKEKVKGIPTPETLRKHLTNFLNQNRPEYEEDKQSLYKLINRFIGGEIKHKGKNKSQSTIRVYRSTLHHLQDFELIKGYRIDFDTITIDFYHKFIDFLQNRKSKYENQIKSLRRKQVRGKDMPIEDLEPNTIGKYIAKIKVFMNEAVELKYTTNIDFRSRRFVVPKEETDAVYLTFQEIEQLYKHNLNNNQRLERVRDMFVFGCYVGLRFQDYSSINPSNIREVDGELFLQVRTQKTGDLAIIPCHPIVLEIFEKYGNNANKLPQAISNQNFNEYIKEACKAADLVETGRLLSSPELPIFSCVSSHTCRRSFATNYYLDGFPTIDLMKITSHRTEKAFLSYIRVSKLDTARRLSQHMRKRWTEKMVKVA